MSTETNGSTEQHALPAELRDADETPLAPRRRSGATIVMTLTLIIALVLLAVAPFLIFTQVDDEQPDQSPAGQIETAAAPGQFAA